jgi:hypothetical protein
MVTCWTTLVFKVWATSILKSGENSSEKGVSQTDFANPSSRARRLPRAATSAPPYPARVRTPRRRETPRSEAHTAATVHLMLMTRVRGLGRCHAARAHSPAGEPPCAIGCRLRCMSPPPPRPFLSPCRPRRWGGTASTSPRAYKTLPLLLPSRARATEPTAAARH